MKYVVATRFLDLRLFKVPFLGLQSAVNSDYVDTLEQDCVSYCKHNVRNAT